MTQYVIVFIIVMAVATALTRFLPFILFGHGSETPNWIKYFGKVLPPAIMSVLLLYCVRNVDVSSGSHGLPEIICIALAIGLHAWKRNTLISIFVSTALYMILVQSRILG